MPTRDRHPHWVLSLLPGDDEIEHFLTHGVVGSKLSVAVAPENVCFGRPNNGVGIPSVCLGILEMGAPSPFGLPAAR